jgi:hypothetical protein
VHKKRKAPFDRLLNFRAGGVNELPQVVQDGFGKVARFGDVHVNSWIFFWHNEMFNNTCLRSQFQIRVWPDGQQMSDAA